MSILERIYAWFNKEAVESSREGPLSGEIYALVVFLKTQIKSPAKAEHLFSKAGKFHLQSYENQLRKLPELYLDFESFIIKDAYIDGVDRKNFRRKIRQSFSKLIDIPSFGIVFKRKDEQELLLGKMYLAEMLQYAIKLLGEGQESFFRISLNWVEQLPKAKVPYPFYWSSSWSGRLDLEVLRQIVKHIQDHLQEQFGENFTSKIFNESFDRIADIYKRLEVFPSIISLLPEEFLSSEKINTLSKHQLAQTLLEKVAHLESLNEQLAAKNKALIKAQQELFESQQENEETLAQLKEIMNTVKEGIIAINEESNILMVNAEMEFIFGYTKEELIGSSLGILMPDHYKSKHADGLRRFLDTKKSAVLNRMVQVEGKRKNGEIFPLQIQISSLKKDSGYLFTAAMRDLSEKVKIEKEIRKTESKAS